MKNKQKAFSKILTLILILCCKVNLPAQPLAKTIEQADSLFANRQYTQSLELYKEILGQRNYSEAMLLKMAFIQEGLGQLSESMYYLQLYYLASNDEQAVNKMNELATKNRLLGYKTSPSKAFYQLIRKNSETITKILVGASAFLFALLIYLKKRQKNPLPVAIVTLFLTAVLFYHVNFSGETNSGIIRSNATYLMSGPSAGSSVISIVNAGHLLDVVGKEDVWLRVKWMEKDAYLKQDQVLMIEI